MSWGPEYVASSITGSWRTELLDRVTGEVVVSLTDDHASTAGITGGSLTWSIFRSVRDDGSLELTLPAADAKEIRWDRVRVRVGWDMLAPVERRHDLGVYLVSSAETTYTGSWASCPLTLHGLVTQLSRVRTTSTYSAPQGAVATDLIAQLIIDAGVARYAVTPAETTLSGSRSWEPGTTHLEIINDLAQSIGYMSVWTDAQGVIRAEPYVAPGDRPTAHRFVDDRDSLYLPGWTLALDDWDTPNRITVMQRVDGDKEPLVTVVTDDNPDSVYGYAQRGYWVDAERLEVDAATISDLTKAGKRKLLDAQSSVQTLSVTYGYLPLVEHDAVVFEHSASGHFARYAISKRNMSVGSALVRAEIRRTLR